LRGETPAHCDLSGDLVAQPVVGVLAENYGPNYLSDSFEHSLSPYFRQKDEQPAWLPLHPRGGGLGFRDWPTCCAPGRDPLRKAAATVRELARDSRRLALQALGVERDALWAFGYEMDNAKVLTWQESHLPLFPEVADVDSLAQLGARLVAAAEEARSLLRTALKLVLGDYSADQCDAAQKALFDRTELAFYATLTRARHSSGELPADRVVRERWATLLRRTALEVFDAYVDAADVVVDSSLRHVKAVALARGKLLADWQARHRKILDLPDPDPRKPRSAA
jgi:hypothetical protein